MAKKILLVEDDFIAGNSAKLILSKAGNDVTWVKTVADGIETALANQYDLIILDIGLPDGHGYDVANAIVAHANETQTTSPPMVALSANLNEDTRAICLASGMVACFSKPISAAVLDSVLNVG